MDSFEGRIAVITGGGTGMGRALAHQLASEGCDVALCDVSATSMAETRQRCEADAPAGTRVTTFVADVSDEAQLVAFKDHVVTTFDTGHIHLLFNNAGIGGGGSMIATERAEWETTFGVDWGGVYLGTRTFLPLLLTADEGHVVNTSSVNGFHAALGPMGPHTAYSAAKFAVKGFTEALIVDFRVNAPHLHAHVVMPGHIGTDIVANSVRVLAGADGDQQAEMMAPFSDGFRDMAPVTAAEAATTILDGVRTGRWRILVGDDAQALDGAVRADPEAAYEPELWASLQAEGHFGGGLAAGRAAGEAGAPRSHGPGAGDGAFGPGR